MNDERKPRLAESLRGFLDSGLDIARTRLELLVVEAQEEKVRLIGLLVNGVMSALFLGFGLVFLAVFLTVLFWDGYRLLALGLATVFFIGAGLFTATNAARELKQGSRMFGASLAELARDREALRRKG
jgi:uncharacterized membrane protein YqjE